MRAAGDETGHGLQAVSQYHHWVAGFLLFMHQACGASRVARKWRFFVRAGLYIVKVQTRMKRILKWTALFLGILLAMPLLGLFGVWAHYQRIVRAQPGALAASVTPGVYGAKVNVFSGTGGVPYMCAHNTPAATTPYGMVRLGPDTESMIVGQRVINRSGYYYGDNKIIGFSHTRLVGADAKEGGVFRVFPTVASRMKRQMGPKRFARFSHREEAAHPGYYAVRLPKERALVELTATPRVGMHRYTFDKGVTPQLLLDVTSSLGYTRCKDGVVSVDAAARTVEGHAKLFGSFSGRYGGLDVYFAARFSEAFTEYGTWKEGAYRPGVPDAAGDDIGVVLGFSAGEDAAVIEVRLAISYVSVANARMNLEAEAADKSFDEVFATARDAWEQRLSRIRVSGGTEQQQRIFYTALYRAFQMPTEFNDVNGEYVGFDGAVHEAADFRYYTDFSLWDTFRLVHPLYNLIARADHRDMMISLVEMAKAGGALPRWPSGAGYTNCMFGTPADVAVSEAYLKGVQDFDIETAYRHMRQTALEGPPPGSRFRGRSGLAEYRRLGYCPSDGMVKSVSATLEYSWSDHALALLAEALGHSEDAALFAKHAQHYRNLWNPAAQFFQPRDSFGNFVDPKDFRPLRLSYVDFSGRYTKHYVEGSAMQWRWAVPYDAEGLVALFTSRDDFISELETYMGHAKPGPGRAHPGGYYWHGNEPYFHAPYLFNAAQRPDRTQYWARWLMDNKYSDDYVGLDGNDDGGTLSSWYVFSALGLYPIAGTTRYELGAPLFSSAEAHIGDRVLTIKANNYASAHWRVDAVRLNGAPIDRTWIDHAEIAEGGVLEFDMRPEP